MNCSVCSQPYTETGYCRDINGTLLKTYYTCLHDETCWHNPLYTRSDTSRKEIQDKVYNETTDTHAYFYVMEADDDEPIHVSIDMPIDLSAEKKNLDDDHTEMRRRVFLVEIEDFIRKSIRGKN